MLWLTSATLTSREGIPPPPLRPGTALSPSSPNSATPTPPWFAVNSTIWLVRRACRNTAVASATISRDQRERLPSHLDTLHGTREVCLVFPDRWGRVTKYRQGVCSSGLGRRARSRSTCGGRDGRTGVHPKGNRRSGK